MTDRDLLILKYLAEYKNITKTANALFIAQPALTKRIKSLENELETNLIQSSNKGIYLTETGLLAAEYATKALEQYEELINRIHEIEDNNNGIIKIAAPNIICLYYLPMLIKAFREEHPNVKFDVTMTPSSKVTKAVSSGVCHFGFSRNDFGWDDEKLLLGVNHISIVSMKPFKLQDLVHMNRISYHTDTYYAKMLELWWKQNFNTIPKENIIVSSLDICKEMVYRGLGYGILPSVFLPEAPDAYTYILQDNEGNPIERNTWLIYKKSILGNKLAREFIQLIQNHSFNEFLQLTTR